MDLQPSDILANSIKYMYYEKALDWYENGASTIIPRDFWKRLMWYYFCPARGGLREQRLSDALDGLDKGVGRGRLDFGVRGVLYFPSIVLRVGGY